MANQLHFSELVASKLQHYVYRLIDPRTGTTFYVGRGQGDRVFSHAAGVQEPTETEDRDELKMKTIWAIKNAGLEVEHVIHRHGLTEAAAREVEAALIDAYPGLTNLQGGYGSSERGVMHAREVISLHEAPEAIFHHHLLLINVAQTSDERPLYDAVRYCWKVSPANANRCEYVLADRKGMIIGAFKADRWLEATAENFPGFPLSVDKRYGFVGQEAPESVKELYLQRRVPAKYRTQNPIRYVRPNDIAC